MYSFRLRSEETERLQQELDELERQARERKKRDDDWHRAWDQYSQKPPARSLKRRRPVLDWDDLEDDD